MHRNLIRAFLSLAAPFLASSAFAQSCDCPPVPPSCEAPACHAPMEVYSGCAEQSTCAVPQGCLNRWGGGIKSRCCRPLIHIDLSKHIVKKNGGSGSFLGEAPPAGYAVPSMAVLPVNITAMPVSFGTNNSVDPASVLALAAAVRKMDEEDRVSNRVKTALDDDLECKDPCGQIKQVEMDVKELKEQIILLTELVKVMNEKTPKE